MRIAGEVLAAAVFLAAAGALSAQDSPEERLQRKLKDPFLARAPWILDFERAKEAGGKSGKLIFAYFTRSYSS